MALAAVALVALGLVASRYHSTRLVAPYDCQVRSVGEVAAEGRRLALEPVEVGSLRALIRRPTDGHSWLLYWGGNTSTYFKEAVDTVAGLQLPPQVGVLIVAPEGYDSGGHPSPEGVEAGAVMAREWLRHHEGAERIVTGGFSMGIYSALVAAERDVRAVVIMGNAPVFETGEPSRLIRLKEPVRYRIRPAPPKVPGLVIQGELDELQMGNDVAQWLGARLVVLAGVSHVETQRNPAGLKEASAFIQERLK